MCGFVGYFCVNGKAFSNASSGDGAAVLRRASDAIKHRGPDDSGIWLSDGGCTGFGFRRLSIQDLSEHGHQPMISSGGRYVIVLNGEIYNFQTLRAELDAESPHQWRGHSDTEVLLELISRVGVEAALAKTDGMFAFALWDNRDKTLTLGRDRFGEKPLYYGWTDTAFVFGSELKALRAIPGFKGDLDRQSMAQFFRFYYIPGDQTIYQSCRKLPAGSITTLGLNTSQNSWPDITNYWNPAQVFNDSAAAPFQGDMSGALDEIDRIFKKSVEHRMITDVPIGAFLSGGIDSSLTAAYAQMLDRPPLQTYTIAFDNNKFNEAPYAQAVADHLDTNHTEILVTEDDALGVIDGLANIYDEPFADSSQIPTMVLCAKAREHVTVALAGDGGDELFCGYNRYDKQVRRWNNISGGHPMAKKLMAQMSKNLPIGLFDNIDGLRGKPGKLGQKWNSKLMEHSCVVDEEFFMAASSFWRDGVPVQGIDAHERALFTPQPLQLENASAVQRFQVLDTSIYLPDDILVKTDRASMAASLEIRTPFLNAELAQFALSLPVSMFDPQEFGLKVILKKLLERHVPANLIDRPKMGFEVPLREWLRGKLKDWGVALVYEPSVTAQEWLDMPRIQKRWVDHQKGANREGDLWPALMMLLWLRNTQ